MKEKIVKNYNQMETSDSSADIQGNSEGSAEISEEIKICEDSYD